MLQIYPISCALISSLPRDRLKAPKMTSTPVYINRHSWNLPIMALNPQVRDILTLIGDLTHNNVNVSVHDTDIIERRPNIPAEEMRNYLNQLQSLGYIKVGKRWDFRLVNITKEEIMALTNQDV